MANHLNKDEYYVLEVMHRLTSSRPLVTRKRVLEFIAESYDVETRHELLDGLRRKGMIVSIKPSGYFVTAKGKKTALGQHGKDKRHKDTFGICEACKTTGTLTFYKQKYVCEKCFLEDNNPLNIEDFVYRRSSNDYTYPSGMTPTPGVTMDGRRRKKKKVA